MRTNYSTWGMSYCRSFRELAAEAERRAAEDLENRSLGKHCGRDGRLLTYSPHAAEAVVLSVTALEAGINEIAVWLRLFEEEGASLPDTFGRLRLTEKWAIVPRVIARAEFNRGTQPWRDFSALVTLRNAFVHFQWQTKRVPRFMRRLHARDLVIPKDPAVYWADAVLTNRVAAWAIQTTDLMFAELTRLMGRADHATWTWR